MSAVSVRLLLALTILIGLSGALVWMLPDDVLARPVFQSPLTGQPQTVTPTLTITGTRQGAPTPLASQPLTTSGQITLPAPSPRPAAAAPAVALPQGEDKAPGFLPPPTLSAPDGRLQPLLPGPGQPLVAPPAPTPAQRPTPAAPTKTSEALSLARLIDTGIVALSYVWLCCGVFVLIGTTLLLVWLARGKGRA